MPCKPQSKLMLAVDVVRRFMVQFNYGIFDGSIYRKAPDAKFTFVFCASVHDFVHSILGNAEVADMIASHVTQIIGLLSVKASRLIEPLVIDYNYIEVLPFGTCFNIEKKLFETDPKDLKGEKVRTSIAWFFVKYLDYFFKRLLVISGFPFFCLQIRFTSSVREVQVYQQSAIPKTIYRR